MAVPKKRSPVRSVIHRANHDRLTLRSLVKCSRCGAVAAHRACRECGFTVIASCCH